jgi:hydroxymethylglutaryl-CoA lyase
MSLPSSVSIVEVGPRDGLQNESAIVTVPAKIALIEALADAGATRIEAGSFVSPKWVPQMAGSDAVIGALRPRAGVTYSALVPNMAGFARAAAAGLREIAIFGAASETFSQRNINCSIAESLERFRPVADAARQAGLRVRGYVSCALGCPYEGHIAPEAVVRLGTAMAALGCFEISIGDTIGVGTPHQARDVAARVADAIGMPRVAVHFHDTYGQALANILACLEIGVSVIDSAVAGLGGCPYARGATGNVATEDVLYMLHGMGIVTGVDLPAIARAGEAISAALGRPTASRVARAMRPV